MQGFTGIVNQHDNKPPKQNVSLYKDKKLLKIKELGNRNASGKMVYRVLVFFNYPNLRDCQRSRPKLSISSIRYGIFPVIALQPIANIRIPENIASKKDCTTTLSTPLKLSSIRCAILELLSSVQKRTTRSWMISFLLLGGGQSNRFRPHRRH
jgi:hypothetical protein